MSTHLACQGRRPERLLLSTSLATDSRSGAGSPQPSGQRTTDRLGRLAGQPELLSLKEPAQRPRAEENLDPSRTCPGHLPLEAGARPESRCVPSRLRSLRPPPAPHPSDPPGLQGGRGGSRGGRANLQRRALVVNSRQAAGVHRLSRRRRLGKREFTARPPGCQSDVAWDSGVLPTISPGARGGCSTGRLLDQVILGALLPGPLI